MSILKVSIDFINQTHGSFSVVSFIIQECFKRIDNKNFIEKINHSEMPLYLFKPIFGLSDKIGLLVPLEAVQACWFIGKKKVKSPSKNGRVIKWLG